MTASDKATRHCPECGKRVQALPEVFERPRKCPGCTKTVTFYDYPHDPPARFHDVVEPEHRVINDRTVTVCFGLFAVVVVVALLAILFGRPLFAVLLSVLCLIFSVLILGLFIEYRRRLLNSYLFIDSIRAVQKPMAEAIAEYETKYRGFSRNYDQIVRDREREYDERAKRNDAQRDKAKEHSQAAAASAARVCEQYIKDCVKWIGSRLTPNNYHSRHAELLKVLDRCRDAGRLVSGEDQRRYETDLKQQFEDVVRKAVAKQEQARIKSQIREEQRREREIQQRMEREESERRAIERALERAISEAKDEHDSEIDELRRQLAEAEAKAERTKSMAEQTKTGHVYIISNIGSFGESVFKVGMTRRLEPLDRVKELGDASVPFPFDVHAMISCDHAPSLEKALHQELHNHRVNRVNFRKEFFRVDLQSIISIVERHHGAVEYVATTEALEYHESNEMTDEEFEFVEATIGDAFEDDED